MKSRLLIIIGIIVVIAVSLSYYAIYESSTTIFISCDPRYEQIDDKCVLLKPEQYCTDWCDLQELSNLGCNQLVHDYIFRSSNLLDEDFDGGYIQNFIGLPEGVSKEKFEECVDFIYEERSSFIISRLHTLNSTEREDFITKYTHILLNGEFHDNVYITDLQNEYAVGEPITFTVATWGYGHPCQSPSFVYYYETKDPVNIVFEDKFIRWCQALKESDYMYYYQELDSNRTTKALNDDIFPVFDKPGSYIVSVDDRLQYTFSVIGTTNAQPVESDRITFQDKSLDYWKSLNENQLREYNSKSDRDEFYYALGELLAKEYFLEKLVELNIINVNDDIIVHTGGALLPDPPMIGFNTVVNATDGFSYVMHTSVQGNRLGEYFNMAQLVFEPHILSAIAENKPAPFTNKFGESPTIYIVTEDGDDKLSSNAVIIDFDQTNTITFVNNSLNPVRIQEVGENKIDEIPKNSWRTKAIVPGESLTMQFNSTGFYEFNVKKITDYFPDYLEHHTEGEIVVFTENMTDYTFAEGLLMDSTFIQDAPRPEIPWQSIGAGNSRGLEIGIVDSVIEAFPNAYEYYLAKAKSLIPFDVPIIIEFSGPIRLD